MSNEKATEIAIAVLALQGLIVRGGLKEEFAQLDLDLTAFAAKVLNRSSGYKGGEE